MSIWVTENTVCPICNQKLGSKYMSDEVFGLPGLITDDGTIDFMDDDKSEFKKFRASTVHKECFKNWTKLSEYIDYWNNLISEIPEEKKKIMSITENGELKVGWRCLKL